MKTLVTGGAGFIGSNIVKRLVAEAHTITVLDNFSSGYRSNLDPFPQIRLIEGDVRNESVLAQAIKDVDIVFHLAASVGNKRSIDNPVDDGEINFIGTLKVLEAARHAGVRKVVFSSSAGIFGELKTLPIREDHPVEPDSPYGVSKLAAEKMCLAYAKLYALEAVCLRYFNVYGRNQRFDAYGNVIPIFVFEILRGRPITVFGDGEQTRDFINIDDVVEANLKAGLSLGVSGAFNIGSGTRITINDLVERIKVASGIEPSVSYGPPRPGDVRDSLADTTAAQRALGFNPRIDISEGLKDYLEWAREESASRRDTKGSHHVNSEG
jgi:UDP-glucose 4-epimerase